VIPPLSTPNCTNVTFPPNLQVDATVDNGALSQTGWIDQCTDISILPKNGTAPYTLTIAPALHSPYNITSNDMSSINWTDSLNYASEFYVGLYESDGNMWSNGPLVPSKSGAQILKLLSYTPRKGNYATIKLEEMLFSLVCACARYGGKGHTRAVYTTEFLVRLESGRSASSNTNNTAMRDS
jgi:hypothetical protein